MTEQKEADDNLDGALGMKLVLAICPKCKHAGPMHPDLIKYATCSKCGSTARPSARPLRVGAR